MSEDNHNQENEYYSEEDQKHELTPKQRMMKKYIFLLVIAVFALIVYAWTYLFQPTSNKEDTNDGSEEVRNKTDNDFNENEITDILDSNHNVNDENETDNIEDKDDAIEEKYDEETLQNSQEQVEVALALFILQENDKDKWKGVTTDDVFDTLNRRMEGEQDGRVERELDNIDLFTVNEDDNEITYGAFVEWRLMSEDETASKRSALFYVTVKEDDNNWIVTEIRNTDAESMEDEG